MGSERRGHSNRSTEPFGVYAVRPRISVSIETNFALVRVHRELHVRGPAAAEPEVADRPPHGQLAAGLHVHRDEVGGDDRRVDDRAHGQRIVHGGGPGAVHWLVASYCRLQLRHFSEAAIPGLKAVEGVFECHLTKDDDETITLEIKMTNRSRVLPRILQIIIENGGEVVNCHLEGLPLEEIFTYALKNSEERQH